MQESQTHLESISPANWTSNDKHKRPVQLHADASLAGAHAAEHVTSPNHLHVGPSAKSSPDSVGDPSPGTPVSYSASPALGASSQLLSEPSSPTLDDCQTPAGQVRATGMMTTPANAKPGTPDTPRSELSYVGSCFTSRQYIIHTISGLVVCWPSVGSQSTRWPQLIDSLSDLTCKMHSHALLRVLWAAEHVTVNA